VCVRVCVCVCLRACLYMCVLNFAFSNTPQYVFNWFIYLFLHFL